MDLVTFIIVVVLSSLKYNLSQGLSGSPELKTLTTRGRQRHDL